MAYELVAIKAVIVNRTRLLQGLGRMEVYERIGCDPRTGKKMLEGGLVRIHTARRLAKALSVKVAEIIDIDTSILEGTPNA